jgi:GNAT superfamily N-acetyltransferase
MHISTLIEQSDDYDKIVVYPHAKQEQRFHDKILRDELFVAEDSATASIIAIISVSLLDNLQSIEDMMGVCPNWHETYSINDVFIYTGTWYTLPHYRRQGVFKALFGYALQFCKDKIIAFAIAHGSKHINLMAGFVDDQGQLPNLLKQQFMALTLALNIQIKNLTPGTCQTSKPFFDLDAPDIKIIRSNPATRYIFSAPYNDVQPLDKD